MAGEDTGGRRALEQRRENLLWGGMACTVCQAGAEPDHQIVHDNPFDFLASKRWEPAATNNMGLVLKSCGRWGGLETLTETRQNRRQVAARIPFLALAKLTRFNFNQGWCVCGFVFWRRNFTLRIGLCYCIMY